MYYNNIATLKKKYKYKMYDVLNDPENIIINFASKYGSLKDSYGEDRFNCYLNNSQKIYPEIANLNNIKDIVYFEGTKSVISDARKQILVITNDYKVYSANLDDGSVNYNFLYELPLNCQYKILKCHYHGDNYLIFSTNTQGEIRNYYYKGNGSPVSQYGCDYYFHDICNHNSQLFLVMEDYRNKIFFAEDVNPINIQSQVSDVEQICIPTNKGKILKLISNGDYLYVICEYGIFRITTYINQKKYYMDDLYSGNYKISENSITVAGNKIFFIDSEGIKEFDGNSIEIIKYPIYDFLFQDINNDNCEACFLDNKYFCTTRINNEKYFNNYAGNKNNGLLIYDINSKKLEICAGISIKTLKVYSDNYINRIAILSSSEGVEQLYTLSNTGTYDFNKTLIKKLVSKNYDFSKSEQKKILKKIYIETRCDVLISIDADGCLYEYIIKGSSEMQNILLNISSYNFNISLVSNMNNSSVHLLKMLVGESG